MSEPQECRTYTEVMERAARVRAWRVAQYQPPAKIVLPKPTQIDPQPEPPPPPYLHPWQHRVLRIAGIVGRQYGISVDFIMGRRKTADIVLARQITAYLARKFCGFSYPEIARRLGGRDHTTALHACNTIELRRQHDLQFDSLVEMLEGMVREEWIGNDHSGA